MDPSDRPENPTPEAPDPMAGSRDLRAWTEVGSLALSYDGYAIHGFDRCAEIANGWKDRFRAMRDLPDTTDELRTCLFFEQRRWRHFAYDPDDEAWTYITALVAKLKERGL